MKLNVFSFLNKTLPKICILLIIFLFPILLLKKSYAAPINLISNKKINPKLESKLDTQSYTEFIYSYLPQQENKLPDRTIWIYLFLPKGGEKHPLVLFLPHITGVSKYIELNLAQFLSEKGFAFITLETGFQKDQKAFEEFTQKNTGLKLASVYADLLKEFIIESQNILNWAKANDNIYPNKICVGGASLGSFAGEFVLGLRPDVNCGIFLLGGGDLDKVFLKSSMFKDIRKELFKNKEAADEFLRYLKLLDPLNVADKLKSKKILMVNALFDTFVPPKSTLKFWAAIGFPHIEWLVSGHVTSVFALPFVQEQMLIFLNENLKNQTVR